MPVIKNLKDVSPSQIYQTFKEAFSHYFVPMADDEALHVNRWLEGGVQFELSYGAYQDEKLLAFVLMAPKGDEIFNLATGVLPSARGQGLTKKIFQELIKDFKNQFKQIRLEVIQQNTPALKTYQSCGFGIKRELLSFKGILRLPAKERPHPYQYRVENYRSLPELSHLSPYIPSFEQDFSVLEKKAAQLELHELRYGEKLEAYAIFKPHHMNLVQMGARNLADLIILLRQMKLEGEQVGLINVDKKAQGFTDLLSGLGLKEYISQFEMVLSL